MLLPLPTLLLGLIIALLYGALYHFARGGNGWRLLFYFGLSILGFAVGQLLGERQNWTFLMLGLLNLGMGTLGSAVFLLGGDWLSRIDTEKESSV